MSAPFDFDMNPLKTSDLLKFKHVIAAEEAAKEAAKTNKFLEEQSRLLRESQGGNKQEAAKERELEALFLKYKCSCYDRARAGSLSICRCCNGSKKVRFEKALAELGLRYSDARGGSGIDSPSGELYWERQGLVFVDSSGRPKNPNRANTSVHSSDVQCPRCNGTGMGQYHCEHCEDTGIPKNMRGRYLAERQSIENRYRYR